jgi:hypothetical protein
MRSEWRFNKRINFGDYEVEFRTLWEDKRDIMCDSPVPEWGISDALKNRQIYVRGRNSAESLRMIVSKEEGNAIYREMVKIDNHGYGCAEARAWVAEKAAR